jgi:hypothetical protein
MWKMTRTYPKQMRTGVYGTRIGSSSGMPLRKRKEKAVKYLFKVVAWVEVSAYSPRHAEDIIRRRVLGSNSRQIADVADVFFPHAYNSHFKMHAILSDGSPEEYETCHQTEGETNDIST